MRATFFSISLLMVTAMPGLAQARPDSLTLSCAAASALVRERGAVVIGTGPDLYDRFVTDPGYCQSRRTEPAWIPTRDDRQCLVGQRCRDRRIQIRR